MNMSDTSALGSSQVILSYLPDALEIRVFISNGQPCMWIATSQYGYVRAMIGKLVVDGTTTSSIRNIESVAEQMLAQGAEVIRYSLGDDNVWRRLRRPRSVRAES